ncbi:Y4yA family PLP-dependent enzyme [Symmachiella dynata]|uniref:Y4yA family PLP-dependent enzyme n=1 Tax=Symmachiella dynata TaxID=2527995 RepID=UPI0030EC4695
MNEVILDHRDINCEEVRKTDADRLPCEGVLPLKGRVEPWMHSACNSGVLHQWVQQYGSPLNVVHPEPLQRNIRKFNDVAESRQLDFQVFFARKANKCTTFVDAANQMGAGIDTASEIELRQALQCGVPSHRIICTAAIKSTQLLSLCVDSQVTIAIDNADEFLALKTLAADKQMQANIALRLSGFQHANAKLESRFGFDVNEVMPFVFKHLSNAADDHLRIQGLHFHLDGYSAGQRVSAIQQTLKVIQELRNVGHCPSFIDIGGGIPMSYLESEHQWEDFWREHRRALLDQRTPITYRNHPLGLNVVHGEIFGQAHCYPFFQRLVGADWLVQILDSDCAGQTIAGAINDCKLQLRCEPGRSLLDGCGMTIARVEFRKQSSQGDWLIGLSMNGTQCRTSSDDFMVDPLLVRSPETREKSNGVTDNSLEGYLVGASCTESDLLIQRKLRFSGNLHPGDLIVFPNTAGYFMHFLESRTHLFPLARNIVLPREANEPPRLDAIDAE